MTKYVGMDSISLDSETLTQWSFDVADANNELTEPLLEQAILCADGSLLLTASNKNMQIAMRVAQGKWSPLDEDGLISASAIG